MKKIFRLTLFQISLLFILFFFFDNNSSAAEISLSEQIKSLESNYSALRGNKNNAQELFTVLIMLPTKYNPDAVGNRKDIPLGDIQKTALEILEKFDQCSTIDPFPKIGLWKRTGVINDIIEDINVTLEMDKVTPAKKDALIKYCREVLLERFKQEAIHMRIIPEKNNYGVHIIEINK
ncbi:MAG: hypothetical protein QMC67_05090 [Candidatus Wallbacteria bacterium]